MFLLLGDRLMIDWYSQRKLLKIRILSNAEHFIIEGIRGEKSIAELCRKESMSQANYYKWSKDFMEAGKKRISVQSAIFIFEYNPIFERLIIP